MFLCNTGKPHCRKASWARTAYNSTGITMQRKAASSVVSIAFPHKPFPVVKLVLKRLEGTAWLWGSMISMQCSSETWLIHDPWQSHFVIFGISPESFMAFSKDVWSILHDPHTSCLSRLRDTFHPLSQAEISHIPCHVSFSWALHYVQTHRVLPQLGSENLEEILGISYFKGSCRPWDSQRRQEWVSLSQRNQGRSHQSLLCMAEILIWVRFCIQGSISLV